MPLSLRFFPTQNPSYHSRTFPEHFPNKTLHSPKNPPFSSFPISKSLTPLRIKPLNPNRPPMASFPLRLKITPQTLALTSVRPFSSSPFPDQNPNSNGENGENRPSPKSSHASLFSDIKERLRSPPSPPRRIPNDPPPPPIASPTPTPDDSMHEVRKHLAQFRLRSSPFPNPRPNPNPPSRDGPMSFQELFKNRNNPQDPNSRPEGGGMTSLFSIRDSLRRPRPSPLDAPRIGLKPTAPAGPSLIGDRGSLPESIFGREMREKSGGKVREGEGEGEVKKLSTEFVKMYSPEELGEKLRMLRPEQAVKGGKDWFSLEELNLRLAKLRELEDKETESRKGLPGSNFSDLRESLMRIKDAENARKASMQRLSILSNISLQSTPSFMNKPPQEQLLENYFHPDHMSSAEKMKLELKKVRDEFKMSESDCGSSRVQIAQLTTKIKHLSSVLHKKDKHSRKGLNEMVQRRKKLLKYLRRTDWESYCFVLSKLGLRDVPEYKVPDYKT